MKATELRIKNLVKYDKRVFEIDVIAHVFPTLNTAEFGIGVVDWNNIEPIPLTEEWLFKFGFEKKKDVYFIKCGIRLYPIRDLYYRGEFPIKRDIIFIHQLQNLYFALMGEELTFKQQKQ